MAYDSAARFPRRLSSALWRMDNLQASVRDESELVSRVSRICVHGTINKVRNNLNLVWSCFVLGFFSSAVGAIITVIVIRVAS